MKSAYLISILSVATACLKGTYCASEELLAQTFKTHGFANLREHLLQFGLVKNLRPLEEIDYPLLGYRFLTRCTRAICQHTFKFHPGSMIAIRDPNFVDFLPQ
jgi:hypothetical protein